MIYYKLRHKESGLFYGTGWTFSIGNSEVETNLVEDGDIFTKRPVVSDISDFYRSHIGLDELPSGETPRPFVCQMIDSDWDVIPYREKMILNEIKITSTTCEFRHTLDDFRALDLGIQFYDGHPVFGWISGYIHPIDPEVQEWRDACLGFVMWEYKRRVPDDESRWDMSAIKDIRDMIEFHGRGRA